MATTSVNYWKRLWRWTTSQNLSLEDLQTVLGKKEVKEALFQGLQSYKPNRPEAFSQLQSKYPDQLKLLNAVQMLQNYVDVDTFQIWDLIQHYLCSISYGTLENALKNVTFLDIRPTFIMPNVFKFYFSERLFLLKLLQYIIDNKNCASHKYHTEFNTMFESSKENLMSSFIEQFEKVITSAPPPRKIQSDFGNETIRQEWAVYNLREQVALLQLMLLLVSEESISVENFQKLFKAFRRHNYGKNQGYHDLLEERHREMCTHIMYLELSLFMIVCDKQYQKNPSTWIEATEKFVCPELTKLQLGAEHSPMLLSWMLLSLESKDHAKLFESKFQHYGATALKLHVFEFLNEMVNSSVLSDHSKCSKIARETIFNLLNVVCDKFDGDGTVSRQPGIFPLCAELLSSQDTAENFWNLHQKEEQFGVVSLWNTALEYFPYNFSMLSILAAGLAQAGKDSVGNLIGELKNLPVYTEMYNPHSVPLLSSESESDSAEAIVGRAYCPVGGYRVEGGSRAIVMERKEGTMIHFRTPCSYWTVLNHEVDKALDRKQHHRTGDTLQRLYEGINVLKGVVGALVEQAGGVPADVMRCSTGAVDAMLRCTRLLPLLAAGLQLCAALALASPDLIHLKLVNTGVLPRAVGQRADAWAGAEGGVEGGAVGAHVGGAARDPALSRLLLAYLRTLTAFREGAGQGGAAGRARGRARGRRARDPALSPACCSPICARSILELRFRPGRCDPPPPPPVCVCVSRGAGAEGGAVGAHVGAHVGGAARDPALSRLLLAYLRTLTAFREGCKSPRVEQETVVPGLLLVLREAWAGSAPGASPPARRLLAAALQLLARLLHAPLALHALLHTEHAPQLLRIVALGNDQLESIMFDETNWVSGPSTELLEALQRCVGIVILALRRKPALPAADRISPLEHLIFAHDKRKDPLKVVPNITSYINHVFNKSLPVLSCRLLKKLADGFQMSLFASFDMSAYQVRVMFLERLRDEHESVELKVAILEFVATCVGKQPGLTEAFFMMNHERAAADDKNDTDKAANERNITSDEHFEGILGYMADYLGTVKSDIKLLHSPLLGCIMAIFHALWKNNMQILVKKLRENPKFWEYMTIPLFNEIQPGLRTYSQIFNVLGIELFAAREKLEPNLREVLEKFFDPHNEHLDNWIEFIFAFHGRGEEDEPVDKVPVWLGLLTSWKDFATIFCKCSPIGLNIAHKSKMVAPCTAALLSEVEAGRDGRAAAMLAELHATMLAGWRHDCFDDRRLGARQADALLRATRAAHPTLHPRALRALLAVCTAALAALHYEINADAALAHSAVTAVADLAALELDRLALDADADADADPGPETGASSAVLALAMLEQALELYEETFARLAAWFDTRRLVSALVWSAGATLARRRWAEAGAALRCLTAAARGPRAIAALLLAADLPHCLWLALLPPLPVPLYASALRLVAAALRAHGAVFAADAVQFAGVHADALVEALQLQPAADPPALALAAAALDLVFQLLKHEARWRMDNYNSLILITRSVSACLCQCVGLALRARRGGEAACADDSLSALTGPAPATDAHFPSLLHRCVEVMHCAALCLVSLSPPLLALVADAGAGAGADAGAGCSWAPLVELQFGAPKLAPDPQPALTFGTLLAAVCLLTRFLNHSYHSEEASGPGGSRSPRGRRRACSCSSPGSGAGAGAGAGAGGARSESVTSVSSALSAPAAGLDHRLAGAALEAATTLLAAQALLAIRDPLVPARHKQLIRRELGSELGTFHEFVRKRILCAAHSRHHLTRNKLGVWPLGDDQEETARVQRARRERRLDDSEREKESDERESDDHERLALPPPKRSAADMREYVLRKHYLDRRAREPEPEPEPEPSPVSHSTPAPAPPPARRRPALKRVSWADTARVHDRPGHGPDSGPSPGPAYSPLTDVQINNDEDYFHFMSVLFLYICQTEL
ncbi:hypothetical protein evm_006859 [Chilo suppressalis]|nr:hypothetical protein evm_006859 [Chilo suppressalis]